MPLTLYNTLTRRKEPFEPLDPENVRVYVCGPTVYDDAHIGNARAVVVFDLLYRVLRHEYGADHVTYVRNITDVEDKIMAAARASGQTIDQVTARTTAQFHADMAALGNLPPDIEPRATGHITEMLITIVSGPLWSKLSDADKKVFQDVFREACARATVEIAAAENRLVDEFATKYGRTVVKSDRAAFKQAFAKFLVGPDVAWDKALYDKVQAIK